MTAETVDTFKPKMVRVIATKPGYDNIKLREPGEEFAMPDTALVPVKDKDGRITGHEVVPVKSSWYVPVEAPAADKPAAKGGKGKKADEGDDLA